MVSRTSTNTCNSVAIKDLVKTLKYLEFLQKVTLVLPEMLFVTVYVKITSYLYCVLYK